VTLTHLFSIFRYIYAICEKRNNNTKLLQRLAIENVGMHGLCNDTKIIPQILSFGAENMKKANNWIFHFQMVKLRYEASPIHNFQQQSCVDTSLDLSI